MRHMKWLTPLILFIVILFSLSACGTSLEKPTGLEDSKNERIEVDKNVDKDREGEVDSFEEYNENEKTDDIKAETDKKSSKEKKSTSNKEKDFNTGKSDNKADQKEISPNQSSEKENDKSSAKLKSKKNENKSTGKTERKAETKQSAKSDQKPIKEKSDSKPKQEPKPKNTIELSVVVSSSEVPLSKTVHEIKEGDTVLDALIAITMDHGVHLDYSGSGGTAYVKGLGNVYEFDRGQGSGWMYRINGVFPDRGVGVVPLKDGDRVEFLYTTDLGKDIGADLKPFRR